MIIAGSDIQLSSKRSYFSSREEKTTMVARQGNRQISLEANSRETRLEGSTMQARMTNLLSAPAQQEGDQVDISLPEFMLLDKMEQDEDGEDLLLDPKLKMTKDLLEELLGKKINITSAEDYKKGDGPQQVQSQGPGGAPPQEGDGGFGVAIDYTRREVEAEATSFAAQGKVTTKDGREIDFALELEMRREFISEEQVSIRMGNMVDPLVVNFDGNAADLTDQRFEFDLDSDGEVEQIPFLASNSGFLAFDRNEDGVINNGGELFGAKTGDGFGELAVYDEDGNNFIDEGDSIYNKLRIYNKTADGQDQLSTLAANNVGAIYLDNASTEFSVNNDQNEQLGQVRTSSVYLGEDGEVGTVQQVDLSV